MQPSIKTESSRARDLPELRQVNGHFRKLKAFLSNVYTRGVIVRTYVRLVADAIRSGTYSLVRRGCLVGAMVLALTPSGRERLLVVSEVAVQSLGSDEYPGPRLIATSLPRGFRSLETFH